MRSSDASAHDSPGATNSDHSYWYLEDSCSSDARDRSSDSRDPLSLASSDTSAVCSSPSDESSEELVVHTQRKACSVGTGQSLSTIRASSTKMYFCSSTGIPVILRTVFRSPTMPAPCLRGTVWARPSRPMCSCMERASCLASESHNRALASTFSASGRHLASVLWMVAETQKASSNDFAGAEVLFFVSSAIPPAWTNVEQRPRTEF
mmetsp:Transcript_119927/g.208255  ORF Transcript_119927/g.208255 Transcript_119927/m.208255 type:complete len:207 (-) Transcript_119927:36-656(-)